MTRSGVSKGGGGATPAFAEASVGRQHDTLSNTNIERKIMMGLELIVFPDPYKKIMQ